MPKSSLPRTVVALSLVSLLTDVSSEMIYPLVPVFLSTVLGAGAMSIGAIEGVAETVAALLKLGSGWWSDLVRRRKPLVVAGYLLASVLRPLIGLAGSVWHVFVIRVGDRVGKGIRSSPRDALIADSVPAAERGHAFGVQRAADHAGAVLGPLVAFVLLHAFGLGLRAVFLLAAIPAAMAMAVLVLGVRERPAPPRTQPGGTTAPGTPLGRRFHAYIGVLLLFTLGNSTDAFLLLRARDFGIATAMLPLLWAALHVVKSLSSVPSGRLSDRIGRRPLILAGWTIYALVYLGFASASSAWQGWVLFLIYGLYFGLTEGVEKALVADFVTPESRGRAFGWYNLAVGIGALPASLIFGALWERFGAGFAFTTGAVVALAAAAGLAFVVPPPGTRT